MSDVTTVRESQYGRPSDNLRCIAELKAVYRKWAGENARVGDYADARDHCIDMILTKIGRIATGRYMLDNYADIGGYSELANQMAELDEGKRP